MATLTKFDPNETEFHIQQVIDSNIVYEIADCIDIAQKEEKTAFVQIWYE